MEELFNALLDISRLDAGVVQPCVTTIPSAMVFDRVRFEYAPVARQKRISLNVMKTSMHVVSDPSLLGRIIRNLLANALRYTDQGGVVLGCRRRGNTVRIEVWDSGRGIPPGQRGDIFRELNADIPALLVTADTAPDRLRDAEASGLPILYKPLNPARLRTLIANQLREDVNAAWQHEVG